MKKIQSLFIRKDGLDIYFHEIQVIISKRELEMELKSITSSIYDKND